MRILCDRKKRIMEYDCSVVIRKSLDLLLLQLVISSSTFIKLVFADGEVWHFSHTTDETDTKPKMRWDLICELSGMTRV